MRNPDSTEPDGADATLGWVLSSLSKKAFQKRHLGAAASSWNGETAAGRFSNDGLRIAERFTVVTIGESPDRRWPGWTPMECGRTNGFDCLTALRDCELDLTKSGGTWHGTM